MNGFVCCNLSPHVAFRVQEKAQIENKYISLLQPSCVRLSLCFIMYR